MKIKVSLTTHERKTYTLSLEEIAEAAIEYVRAHSTLKEVKNRRYEYYDWDENDGEFFFSILGTREITDIKNEE